MHPANAIYTMARVSVSHTRQFFERKKYDFMFQEVMVCVTCSPSILSLIISNFLLVFKISQKFVEFYVYRF